MAENGLVALAATLKKLLADPQLMAAMKDKLAEKPEVAASDE